jgi:hypothetical protein
MSFGIPVRNGLGVGLLASTTLSTRNRAPFSPASLFATGEQGAWYDPSDLTTLFQDSAGTTPVTAAGQQVGRINDKSGRGNNATQSNSAQRPTLGREPYTGRVNLLTFTEQFDNAAWTKAGTTVTANAGVAPDGTTTADKLIETATTGSHLVRGGAGVPLNGVNTISVYAKAAERSAIVISLIGSPFNAAYFDLSGVQARVLNGGSNATIQNVGDGWYRCSYQTASLTSYTGDIYVAVTDDYSRDAIGYTGNGTSGIFIWGAQLETGSTATAYQRVVSSFDVTQAGVPDVWYLSFDGTDDGMLTGTITPGIDKAQVFAGVRKLSDAVVGVFAETSTDSFANNGTLAIFAPSASNGRDYFFRSKGTVPADVSAVTFTAPITNVITGIGDIAGDVNTVRVNGLQVGTSAGNQGTGNYLAYPFYIGRRGGTTFPLNGRIYSLILRFGANLSASTILQTETWVGDKTGINIPLSVSPTIYDRFNDTVLDRAGQTIEVR